MRYREEILNQYDDVGLRGLLLAHSEDVCEVEFPAPNVIDDMDLPEDYERETEQYKTVPDTVITLITIMGQFLLLKVAAIS